MDENLARIVNAVRLAEHFHQGQIVPHTGVPYFVHVAETVGIVSMVTRDSRSIAAAYLHDILEVTDVTPDEIKEACGKNVLILVDDLTNAPASIGDRQMRHAADLERLRTGSSLAQSIKLAAIISNAIVMKEHNSKVWNDMRDEKVELILTMKRGSGMLQAMALSLYT